MPSKRNHVTWPEQDERNAEQAHQALNVARNEGCQPQLIHLDLRARRMRHGEYALSRAQCEEGVLIMRPEAPGPARAGRACVSALARACDLENAGRRGESAAKNFPEAFLGAPRARPGLLLSQIRRKLMLRDKGASSVGLDCVDRLDVDPDRMPQRKGERCGKTSAMGNADREPPRLR